MQGTEREKDAYSAFERAAGEGGLAGVLAGVLGGDGVAKEGLMPLIFCRRERRGGLRRRPCDGLLCTSDGSRRAQDCRGTLEGVCDARGSEGGRFFARRSCIGGAGEGGCENSERRGGGGPRNVVINILSLSPCRFVGCCFSRYEGWTEWSESAKMAS